VEREHDLLVTAAAVDQRLDVFVAAQVPEASRSRVRAWIDAGLVTVDGEPARASHRVAEGERVRVSEPAPAPSHLVAQALDLDVLFEDEHVVVLDKPAGLVVHPGAGNPDGTLANALLHRYPNARVGGEGRAGIVHRLDKETSGVMVCALTDDAHQGLSAAFKARAVDKRYLAFCIGRPRQDRFELDTGHKRHPTDRRRYSTKLPPPEQDGGAVRRARSVFRVVRAANGLAELEVEILTGRTHQIRAHLADIQHPIAGDALYGGGNADKRVAPGPVREAVRQLARQALHAQQLAFDHPATGERLTFEAPLPEDLALLRAAIESAS
jgi:23S rRNA pseudouridine1911/1915/1917 synthase